MRTLLIAIVALTVTGSSSAADPPLVEKYLHAGEFAKGEQALEAVLAEKPGDDQARFGLGMLRFLRAIERLCQSLYEYGMKHMDGIPLLRLPVAENPQPNRLSHLAFRRLLDDFRRDLALAEAPLVDVRDANVKLPLRLAAVRLDLDGDGKATDTLVGLAKAWFGRNFNPPAGNADYRIGFDRADVSWLRGYCHLLMGLTDFLLAFDGRGVFEIVAHFAFVKPHTAAGDGRQSPDLTETLNKIEVREPARLRRSRTHLLEVCRLSRETWKLVLAESDDDHEWLPSPKQTGALGVRVTQPMIDSWLELIGEAEAVLDGKKLMPLLFLGGPNRKPVNLRRFLEKPPERIDLMKWSTDGPTEYEENGVAADERVWQRAERVFAGNFLGFAMWFN